MNPDLYDVHVYVVDKSTAASILRLHVVDHIQPEHKGNETSATYIHVLAKGIVGYICPDIHHIKWSVELIVIVHIYTYVRKKRGG